MSTWLEIVSDAYAEVGAKALGNDLTGDKTDQGRRLLNRMLGQWRLQRKMVSYLQNLPFALTTATSYTIGPASTTPDLQLPGASDTRPVKIERANLREGSAAPYIYTPLDIIPVQEFADDPWRESPGQAYSLYYKRTFPAGTLFPWPFMCIAGNYLELFIWNQLVSIAEADLATEAVLDDGQEDAIVMSLAERLLTLYPGRSNESEIIRRAGLARAYLQTVNAETPRMDTRLF